jgi:UDP-glucose 4-epimerase
MDCETLDGTAIRDCIQVEDSGAAHIASLELLMANHIGDVFSVGTEIG